MIVVSILFYFVGVIGVGACGPDMLVGPLWSLPVAEKLCDTCLPALPRLLKNAWAARAGLADAC